MKRPVRLLLLIVIVFVMAVAAHLYWLNSLQGNEHFPADTFLGNTAAKTALIVVAHDDDAIGCMGTIAELTKNGWQVQLLTFYGNWRKEDNHTRKKEVAKVANIVRLAHTDLVDFSIQQSDTVTEPWRPIPYDKFPAYFRVDSLQTIIATAIDRYKPTVVFTLDNIIGGYGHPEHVCVSQSVLDICTGQKNDPGFSVQRIYQAVFTRTLNENVLRNNIAFVAAKEVYQAEGSPVPSVEVDISHSAKEKKEVMQAFASQKRNLKKIWPFYHWYPSWLYFNLFNKEYFHVVTLQH